MYLAALLIFFAVLALFGPTGILIAAVLALAFSGLIRVAQNRTRRLIEDAHDPFTAFDAPLLTDPRYQDPLDVIGGGLGGLYERGDR